MAAIMDMPFVGDRIYDTATGAVYYADLRGDECAGEVIAEAEALRRMLDSWPAWTEDYALGRLRSIDMALPAILSADRRTCRVLAEEDAPTLPVVKHVGRAEWQDRES